MNLKTLIILFSQKFLKVLVISIILILIFTFVLKFWFVQEDDRGSYARQFSVCERAVYEPMAFESSERFECYRQALITLVRDKGLGTAVEALRVYLGTSEGQLLAGARCHALGHDIGITAVREGVGNEELLTTCGDFCGFGCLDGASHVNILISGSVSKAEEFCNVSSVEERIRSACYHGIGHGLMEYNNFNIEPALSMCDKLEHSEAKYQCGHAVLMDPRLIEEKKNIPDSFFPEKFPDFCYNKPGAPYQDTCFEFTGYLTYAKERDVEKASQACMRLDEGRQKRCQFRLGEALFFDRHALGEASYLGKMCASQNCIAGIVLTSLHGPDGVTGEFASLICKTLSGQRREGCFNYLGAQFGAMYPSQRIDFCSKLESSTDKESCLKYDLEEITTY